MVEKVWVGKKVQVLSLEELEKNHYKDKNWNFWFNEERYNNYFRIAIIQESERRPIVSSMQPFCGKVCEVSEVRGTEFLLKENRFFFWNTWMVKEPVSIQDVLNSD